MAKDPVYADFAYLTFDDIKQLSTNPEDTLIAIKAPIGAKIEIPDPDEVAKLYIDQGMDVTNLKKYQVFLNSKKDGVEECGEILAYIIDQSAPSLD
jgi:hypothetical protein